jgi:hypothetical protein
MKLATRTILAILLAFLVLPSLYSNQAPMARPYDVINLMGEYFEFWNQAETLDADDRIELFRATMMGNHPELYNPDIIQMMGDDNADERLHKHLSSYLEKMQPLLGRIRQLSEQAGVEFEQAEAAFQALFGDFDYDGEIYFMPSLLYFDGATRTVKGRMALLLAPDGMAFYHGENFKVVPLFHHELFHIYQEQFLPEQEDEPLYVALWREGLAVHAAKTLNPDATPDQLVLMDLMETLPPVLPEVAGQFLSVMDQSSEDWYRIYFSNGDHEFIPQRAGYYLGQLVAQQIAGHMNWSQMMALNGQELRNEIASALSVLAKERAQVI